MYQSWKGKKNKIRRTYVLHEPPVSTSHNKLQKKTPQMQKQTALTRNVLPEILKQKLNMRSKGRALPGKLGVFRYLS
jgi:hypothetical protein